MNKIILTGRIGKDIELKHIPSTGKAIAEFSLAVTRPYTGKDGQKATDWFDIKVWGQHGENCAKFLRKGSKVLVEGSMEIRKWQDKDNNNRYSHEVIARQVEFLDNKLDNPAVANKATTQKPSSAPQEISDEDMPFA
jgi:single-strand DNA-binding protein